VKARRKRPRNFAANAHLSQQELCRRYRTGPNQIRRWREEIGMDPDLGRPGKIPVEQLREGERIAVYASVSAAARAVYHGNASNILRAVRCGGTAYGYQWREYRAGEE
jgi:hypothetical protein